MPYISSTFQWLLDQRKLVVLYVKCQSRTYFIGFSSVDSQCFIDGLSWMYVNLKIYSKGTTKKITREKIKWKKVFFSLCSNIRLASTASQLFEAIHLIRHLFSENVYEFGGHFTDVMLSQTYIIKPSFMQEKCWFGWLQ